MKKLLAVSVSVLSLLIPLVTVAPPATASTRVLIIVEGVNYQGFVCYANKKSMASVKCSSYPPVEGVVITPLGSKKVLARTDLWWHETPDTEFYPNRDYNPSSPLNEEYKYKVFPVQLRASVSLPYQKDGYALWPYAGSSSSRSPQYFYYEDIKEKPIVRLGYGRLNLG